MLCPVSWQRVAVFVSATTSLAVLLAGCNGGSNSDHSSGHCLQVKFVVKTWSHLSLMQSSNSSKICINSKPWQKTN
eukprot:5086260-Amphidinium_carterae.1